ncbi:MAG: M48 family metalloprotease [Marinobacterium sp.]|nr:M48 family metalloprotease [Marinobacterium sp.]
MATLARLLRTFILTSSLLLLTAITSQAQTALPEISHDSYGGITLNKEYQLGRNWVRSLRRQANLMKDPAGRWYLEQLVWQLAANSQLADHRLEIVTLDNKTFNAFAVPGGIIGLHGGLMLYAHSEGELASVIAHELAHLSQRHFASQLEQQRRSKPLILAGMLAGILLSTVDSEATTAAISTTLAASSSAQLSFSRRNEREADRIGMQTLAASGYNPHAMPMMFGRLLTHYRFASKPPEFLSTHPLSENRVADSQGRAAQLSGNDITPYKDPLPFHLIRARLQIQYDSNPARRVATLKDRLQRSKGITRARLRYALYIAQVQAGQFKQADQSWQQLPSPLQQHWLVQLSRAEQQLLQQRPNDAVRQLQNPLSLYPDNWPLQLRLAEAYHQAGNIKAALKLYRQLAQQRPTDVDIHYQLAELYGLAGNVAGVHRARTEYFLLVGDVSKALRQLKFAQREKGLTPSDIKQFEQLEQEAKQIRKQMKEGL